MPVEEDAYKYAIKNAALHSGKAGVGPVIGKLKALHPKLNIPKLTQIAVVAVQKVNSMEKAGIEKEFAKFEKQGYELKPKEKTEALPPLEWAAREKVVTRYAPNPNGPFHLGNARAAIISDEFAKKHRGKMLLRFDDTDPKVKKPIENAEALFKEDLQWLGCKIEETYFASDRLELYYKYMKEAIRREAAYVCTCPVEEWREKTKAKKPCECRNLGRREHAKRFEKMLKNEFKEGQAVLRIKTDLEHKDPSVRDWWAAKVVDKPEHPNQKAKGKHVWPSYNFASAIDDHALGVSLIVRGQEHEQNKTKQEFLYKCFKWKYPHCFHFGRISLQGIVLSTSRIKEGIEKGLYTGWDDPRLGTIRAFRRRGFKAAVLRQAILDLGVNTNDAGIQWAKLIDLNKKLIEPLSERLSFIAEPMVLEVHMAPNGMNKLVVDKKQFENFKEGEVVRLRQLFNVKINKIDPLQVFAEFIGEGKINKPIVNWFKQGKDIEIVMDDAGKVLGLADERIEERKEGQYVQLDGLGFCIVDEKQEGKVLLRFAHK
ncbi:MAG: glutamate--tRNA ligase [Candidatus Diapherotrites archaeon]|uniref:Glutamate--tRNA ligase n=1 Tax=Candidatus Iainarchaeum sp. TaxID=3101447 RepID=A0A938YP01_9ARCH|nr:glutamate--tRNA ligase [Candidatus Diapherotrites archaeon]